MFPLLSYTPLLVDGFCGPPFWFTADTTDVILISSPME